MSQAGLTGAGDAMVDVILPAYNGGRFIRTAIDSALAQDGVPLRIIVIDDGSTDDTAEVARSYGSRVTLFSQTNRGVSGARNRGLAVSTSRYVALLDQDDIWQPGKLRRQVELLGAHPSVGLVFTDMVLFKDAGQVVEDGFLRATPAYARLPRQPLGDGAYLLPETLADSVMRENFISPSTVLLRRDAIHEVGGFDETLRLCDDAECWMRLLRTWRAIAIEKRLVLSRVWDGNASLQTDRMIRERIGIGEKVFAHPERFPSGAREYFARERAACFYRLGTLALRDGDAGTARQHLLASLRQRPRVVAALLLAATFLGPRGRTLLAQVRRMVGLRLALRVK